MHFSEAYKVADTVYELRSDAVKLCKAKSPQVDKRCTSYVKYPACLFRRLHGCAERIASSYISYDVFCAKCISM